MVYSDVQLYDKGAGKSSQVKGRSISLLTYRRVLHKVEEGQNAPQTQHHLQALSASLWDHTASSKDQVDAIAEPEASVARQSGCSKHVVASKFPHACQKLHKTAKEQGKS